MKWSWKLFRVAGIDVYIHATFFILILWIAMAYWQAHGNLAAVISGVGFILALFGCVLLHELGHALTARHYGLQTRHITLLPIGGVASMEGMPKDPRQEILVALAGPAVNLVIGIGLFLWLSITRSDALGEGLSFASGSFTERLMIVNFILAIFNLLPAFPMDGGRVLRAALALRMNHNQATQIAARIGQALALWLGFIGLLYNPFLMFIALFVWIGATAEAGMEEIKTHMTGVTAAQVMLHDFQILSPGDPLSRAIELTLLGSQKDFPVMQGTTMVGVLSQKQLLQGLQKAGDRALVKDWMETDVQSVDVREPLDSVLERLQGCGCRLLAVTDRGRLVGVLDLDNVMEWIRIQSALQTGTVPAGREL